MSDKRRRLIVSILLVSAFVAILNQTLLNVALPEIMESLGVNATKAQWLMTGFMLVNGIMIPTTAFLMDKFSTRFLFVFAMGMFSVGTIIAAFAPVFEVLLLARIIQAMGAGIIMPLMQYVLFSVYPPERRGSAMGLAGLVISFAPAIGPSMAGFLVDEYTWRSPFYVIIPISLTSLVFGYLKLEDVSDKDEVYLDILSIIMSTIGFGSILYGFSMAGTLGIQSVTVIISILLGVIVLALFFIRQLKLEHPFLNVRVLKYPLFFITTIAGMICMMSMIGPQLLLPMYIQDIRGYSALHSGLVLLPGAILMGLMSVVTGRLYDKYGAKWLSLIGFSLIVVTSIMLGMLSESTSYYYVMVMYTVRAFAVAMVNMPIATAGLNSLPRVLISHGTAVANALRTVAGSIGTALLVTIMSLVALKEQQAGSHMKHSMIVGIDYAFYTAAIIAFIGLVLSWFIKNEKPNLN